MTNPVAILRRVTDGETQWDGLVFVCPGCKTMWPDSSGVHMLPVNAISKTPSWTWDGNLETPTLSPSILTKHGPGLTIVCHSFLIGGIFQFLEDCTHTLKGQSAEMVPLEDWML